MQGSLKVQAALAAFALWCFACASLAKNAVAQVTPRFHVASIKPSPPNVATMPGMNMGMGCIREPDRITCRDMPLVYYVRLAYGIKRYQLRAPGWMSTDRFDVVATFPPDTTSDHLQLMERALLAARFGLVVHHEVKPGPVHELVVARGGAKLRMAGSDHKSNPPETEGSSLRQYPIGRNGCPVIPDAGMPSGGWITVIVGGGQICLQGFAKTIDALATRLERFVNGPVADGTGLTGRYDVSLGFLPEGTVTAMSSSQAPPPPLADALLDQLGLRLAQKTGELDAIVVDQCNRMPISN